MVGSKLLGPVGMVMIRGMTHGKWKWSSMLVADGVGVGIGTGFIGLVEGRGHCFGVTPNVEQILLVARVEASLAVNMMVFLYHRVWEMWGDLGEGDLLGGMTVGVDGTARIEGVVETRVALEFSPWGELLATVLSWSTSEPQLTLTARKLFEKVVAAWYA